jgi:AraC family transcriptional regulator
LDSGRSSARISLSPRSLQRSLQGQDTELRQLIREGRVEAARALLLRTDVPISLVAYLCGFSDAAHLTNVARSLLGVTPSELRKQAQLTTAFAAY